MTVHGITVMGAVACTMCPKGLCTESTTQVDPLMTVAGNGLALIGEMNRQDLIEEIILGQRSNLASASVEQLREFVVQLRMHAVRKRLIAEAGITAESFGWFS
jgi:hypothetical protein